MTTDVTQAVRAITGMMNGSYNDNNQPLTYDERQRLQECEEIIDRGLNSFRDVGTALGDVRDKRLYREEYSTFEDYCRDKWNLSRPYTYQLIDAAEIAKSMSAIADTPVVANEAQARELRRVPEDERADLWREVNERTNGKPTAKAIRETNQEHRRPKPNDDALEGKVVDKPSPNNQGPSFDDPRFTGPNKGRRKPRRKTDDVLADYPSVLKGLVGGIREIEREGEDFYDSTYDPKLSYKYGKQAWESTVIIRKFIKDVLGYDPRKDKERRRDS